MIKQREESKVQLDQEVKQQMDREFEACEFRSSPDEYATRQLIFGTLATLFTFFKVYLATMPNALRLKDIDIHTLLSLVIKLEAVSFCLVGISGKTIADIVEGLEEAEKVEGKGVGLDTENFIDGGIELLMDSPDGVITLMEYAEKLNGMNGPCQCPKCQEAAAAQSFPTFQGRVN